jgi:hypothetical protein
MKIEELNIENHAKNCEVPAFFIHGGNDNFIVPEHT